MKNTTKDPGILSELGTIAGLYRTVFWMMGQRLQRGPHWEERLAEDALKLQAAEETVRQPHHHARN